MALNRNALALIAFALLPGLSGCYPMHASLGHLDLMKKRQSFAEIMANPATPPELKNHLRQVEGMREFAVRELKLPDNGAYRNYAPLDRDYVLWNVWVTPEFDLKPRQSCFPIAGCVPYRGYYSQEMADAYAARFESAGDDVMVRGVLAYSSLGFFDDPVTSVMLRLSDERLAGLIFHELAHQVVYIRNNTTFNESFARAVEIESTLRWLSSKNDEAGIARYRAALGRSDLFFSEVKAARAALARVYASEKNTETKRAEKEAIFKSMRDAHHQRKNIDTSWAAYDPWFSGELNNATLVAVATYFDDVEMFRGMLDASAGNFDEFYEAARTRAAQVDRR